MPLDSPSLSVALAFFHFSNPIFVQHPPGASGLNIRKNRRPSHVDRSPRRKKDRDREREAQQRSLIPSRGNILPDQTFLTFRSVCLQPSSQSLIFFFLHDQLSLCLLTRPDSHRLCHRPKINVLRQFDLDASEFGACQYLQFKCDFVRASDCEY